jgi:hypothetical protein
MNPNMNPNEVREDQAAKEKPAPPVVRYQLEAR